MIEKCPLSNYTNIIISASKKVSVLRINSSDLMMRPDDFTTTI